MATKVYNWLGIFSITLVIKFKFLKFKHILLNNLGQLSVHQQNFKRKLFEVLVRNFQGQPLSKLLLNKNQMRRKNAQWLWRNCRKLQLLSYPSHDSRATNSLQKSSSFGGIASFPFNVSRPNLTYQWSGQTLFATKVDRGGLRSC